MLTCSELFEVNLMGRFSTFTHALRFGPSGGTSLGQGEQPRAITKPAAVPHSLVNVHPPPAARLPPIAASSLSAVNQGRVISRGSIRPSHNLPHSPPHVGRGKHPTEGS